MTFKVSHAKLLVHVYIWPKIIHYLHLVQSHLTNIDQRTTLDSLQFFLNVPVYAMAVCYVFDLRLPGRKVLIGIYLLAVFDELQYFVRHAGRANFGFGEFTFEFYNDLETLVMLAPLYTIVFLYLFASDKLWNGQASAQ